MKTKRSWRTKRKLIRRKMTIGREEVENLAGQNAEQPRQSKNKCSSAWKSFEGGRRSSASHMHSVHFPMDKVGYTSESPRGNLRRRQLAVALLRNTGPPFWVVTETDSGAHAFLVSVWVTLFTISDLGRSCATSLHAFAARSRLVTADQIWSPAAHTGPGRGTPFLKLIYLSAHFLCLQSFHTAVLVL